MSVAVAISFWYAAASVRKNSCWFPTPVCVIYMLKRCLDRLSNKISQNLTASLGRTTGSNASIQVAIFDKGARNHIFSKTLLGTNTLRKARNRVKSVVERCLILRMVITSSRFSVHFVSFTS